MEGLHVPMRRREEADVVTRTFEEGSHHLESARFQRNAGTLAIALRRPTMAFPTQKVGVYPRGGWHRSPMNATKPLPSSL
jgi:hypothetical protein